jgi:uncharacterized protein (DUF433 family)
MDRFCTQWYNLNKMLTDEPVIHDRGRGPEIRGTRITVFDILDYSPKGWTPGQIAALFKITIEQVQAALAYIEEHRSEVMPKYQRMLDFAAKGDSLEVRAQYARSHARLMALQDELKRRKGAGADDARIAG